MRDFLIIINLMEKEYYIKMEKKFEEYFKSGKYNGIGIEYLSNGKRRRKMKYEKRTCFKRMLWLII